MIPPAGATACRYLCINTEGARACRNTGNNCNKRIQHTVIHMNINKLGLCAALLSASSLAASASGSLPYVNEGKNLAWWGTGKSETYDVAAYIGPEFKGMEIQNVIFRGAEDAEVSDFSIWLSQDLLLDSENKNIPDVLTSEVEVKSGKISLDLAQPYTISENGVYIGFSFKVNNRETTVQKSPVAVIRDGSAGLHGLYVHSSRTYVKWTDNPGGSDSYLPFEITLGNVADHDARITIPEAINGAVGSEITFDAELTNFGAAGASAVELEWTVDNRNGIIPISLPEPLPAMYRVSVPLSVTLPALDQTGTYNLKVKVVSVDGSAGASASEESLASLDIWSRLPKKRPLFEEYTSTSCGYCPRGPIGMAKMEELYGSDFVSVVYHHADIMSILTPEEYPNAAPSQPVAWLDRVRETDPYFGDLFKEKVFGIDRVWADVASDFTPADISLACAWTDNSHNTLSAESSVSFVKAFDDCDFRLSYILVADGLTGTGRGWRQGNYYSGQTDAWPADFDDLVNSPNPIDGVVFDHVAIYSPSVRGIENSLPAKIGEGETVKHSISISLDDAVNLNGESLIQDGLEYSVVAVLLDAATGDVINCVKTKVADMGAVGDVTTEEETVSVEYFDIMGRSLPGVPSAGIYIECRRQADGRCITRKLAGRK